MERKALSKRLRFEIFKRDRFRCTYCGATPVDRPLHVDHVKPVVEGGTNEPHNLVTACHDCNAGKGPVPLEKKRHAVGKLTEADEDHAEQIKAYLDVQRDVAAAKSSVQDQLLAEWAARIGEPPRQLRSRLVRMVSEFGIARLVEAFDIVAAKEIRYETAQLKYLYGVLRRWREEANPTPPPQSGKKERPRTVRVRTAVYDAIADLNSMSDEERKKYDIVGTVCSAFAKAAGAAADEVETYYADGSFFTEEYATRLSGGVEIHGIRLRAEAKPDNKMQWFVEEIEGYDPFREAYEEISRDAESKFGYWLAYFSRQDIGQDAWERRHHYLEEDAKLFAEALDRIKAWINKHKTEDLGEKESD